MIPLLSYKIFRDGQDKLVTSSSKPKTESDFKGGVRRHCKCVKSKRIKKPSSAELIILLFGMFGVPFSYAMYSNMSRLYIWASGGTTVQPVKVNPEKSDKIETISSSLRSLIAERLKNKYKYSFEYSWTQIDRRTELSIEEFKDMYSGKWPVIITDCGKNWPSLKKWTKTFFLKHYGKELVTVKTSADGVQENFLMPFDLFLSHIDDGFPNQWTYINDEMFIPSRPQLEEDLGTCKELEEDFFRLFPLEVRPWWSFLLWGTRYSRSDLHIDPFNWTGTTMVLSGLKRWKLFPPGQDHLLHVKPSQQYKFPINLYKYNSYVDCFNIDHLKQYPSVTEAKVLEFYQYPGEMLIIPSGWFHQAFNEEATLAVSGQVMNEENYKYILEEMYKGGEIDRVQDTDAESRRTRSARDHVQRVLSRINEQTLAKGRDTTLFVYDQARRLAEASNLPKPPLFFDRFVKKVRKSGDSLDL